ncbi:MAG: hypothetical protein QF664_12640 [Dehalococcoidia bacterium]|jgi:hypothetical protein|nr:hypothetical protein [Dehalococcoidia bacterium]
MRYVILGILAFVALVAGAIAILVVADVTLAELRDVVIVVYGVFSILLLIVVIVALTALYFAVRMLSNALTDLLRDPVKPALEDLRASARNVRGATEFAADSAVHPMIRMLSFGRGIRRGIGLVAGLRRRGDK